MTLAEFLLARIAEDERSIREDDYLHAPHVADCGWAQLEAGAPCKCRWPQRLADEAASRRRLVRMDGTEIMRLIALPYADHPDYREEWKP